MAPKNVAQEPAEVSGNVEALPQTEHAEQQVCPPSPCGHLRLSSWNLPQEKETLHSFQNTVQQLTLDSFVEMHRNQLESSAVPRAMWPALYRKIAAQAFDAGSAFSLMQLQDEEGALAGWKAVVVKEGGVRWESTSDHWLEI